MASIGARINRASGCLRRIPTLSQAQRTNGNRSFASLGCLHYQKTMERSQLVEIPADKYQRTTITEDVRRAASRENWADPRANAVDNETTLDEGMLDPTIRHFTVNFVWTFRCFGVLY
jgi:hypothetical protein